MKKLLILFFSVGTLMNMPQFSFAMDENLKTYPIQAIFWSNNSNQEESFMSEEFKTLIKQKQKSFFIPEFITKYNSNFSNTTNELTNKNKYKTIVSYISIPRASKYIVKKPDRNEIYLPLTVSLTFLNILTGETLYSTSDTLYDEILYENNYDKIANHYQNSYKKMVTSVIEKSKQSFHPFEIPANVVEKYRNLYVLNKGSESGISDDDLLFDDLDNQLSIIYSNLNYSIAKPVLVDNVKLNSTFIKQSNNGGINQIKKPKVLLINDVLNSSIYDLLVSNLGENSKISLITTNPTFHQMRKTVIDLNNNFKSTNIAPKNVPDYFLLFSFTKPTKTSFKQNQSGLDSIYYQVFACGSIFDKTGKIVFSHCADDKTEPRYSNQEYKESESDIISILYKNLIAKISEEINSKIEFREYDFKIKKVNDNEIVLEDKTEVLSEGDSVTIFKKIDNYLIPLFKYNVIFIDKGNVTCSLDFPYTDDIEKPSKSNIAKSQMIVSNGGINSYKLEPSQIETDSEIKIDDLDKFITPMIAANFKKPLSFDEITLKNKADMINNTSMFKNKLNIINKNTNLKIIPFYSVKLTKHKVKGYTKTDTYKLNIGLKIFNNEKIVNEKNINQEITITLPLKNDKETLQIELLKVIYPTINQLVKTIK